VGARFSNLLDKLNINGRKRLGFYTLRHNFETIAGGSKDQVAVDALMGHVDSSMAAVYREGIEDDRLRAVTDHVHLWLFGDAVAEAAADG
jgi:integrase